MTPVAKIVAHTSLSTRKFMMSTAGSMRPPMSKVSATPGTGAGDRAERLGRAGRHAVVRRVQPEPDGARWDRSRRPRRRQRRDARFAAHDQHPAGLDDARVRRERRIAVRVPGLELPGRCRRPARCPTACRPPGPCRSSRSPACRRFVARRRRGAGIARRGRDPARSVPPPGGRRSARPVGWQRARAGGQREQQREEAREPLRAHRPSSGGSRCPRPEPAAWRRRPAGVPRARGGSSSARRRLAASGISSRCCLRDSSIWRTPPIA